MAFPPVFAGAFQWLEVSHTCRVLDRFATVIITSLASSRKGCTQYHRLCQRHVDNETGGASTHNIHGLPCLRHYLHLTVPSSINARLLLPRSSYPAQVLYSVVKPSDPHQCGAVGRSALAGCRLPMLGGERPWWARPPAASSCHSQPCCRCWSGGYWWCCCLTRRRSGGVSSSCTQT